MAIVVRYIEHNGCKTVNAL
uniref:Uncharacterized protein n=1 Tax=Arundo donax TaxID=35708 RepID=A0A0A8ZF63_ARUDO